MPPFQPEEARAIEAQREPTINLMRWADGSSRECPSQRNPPIQLPRLADYNPEPLIETPTKPPEEGQPRQVRSARAGWSVGETKQSLRPEAFEIMINGRQEKHVRRNRDGEDTSHE